MGDCEEVVLESQPQEEEELGLGFTSNSFPSSTLVTDSGVDSNDVPIQVSVSISDPDPNLVIDGVETLVEEFHDLVIEEKEKDKEKEKENVEEEEEEEKEKKEEEEEEKKGEEEKKKEDVAENEDEDEEDKEDGDSVDRDSVEDEEINKRFEHPQRPDQPDCPYYLRTGACKFGRNCKFNHPSRRKNQVRSSDSPEPFQDGKEKEDFSERVGQPECKYYLSTGGCKFGKACRYNHAREKTVVVPPLDFNFLGLPIRPGERECPYYMRTGSCKYAANCRFNHPDPSAAGACDPPAGYNDGGAIPLQSLGTSQPAVATWSLSRTSNETIPYLDASAPFVSVVLPSPQAVHQNSDWNGYQAPVYPPERRIHPPSTLVPNNTPKRTDGRIQHQQQILVEEFPERPGQPVCSYFVKNGDCKFRSGCKYHHPKNRVPVSPMCTLSPMGLPLRPDQSVCTHYSRYGICKFGPACKFNHPINYSSSGQSSSFGNHANMEGVRMPGYGKGNDSLIQQSV